MHRPDFKHTRLRRPAGAESGVAMVEFALVLPLLLTLLFGILDFGKAFNYWIDETHLASEGARWAAVNKNPGTGSLVQYIQQQADTAELRSGGTAQVAAPAKVCISFPNGTQNAGDPVEVTVSITYNWLGFIRTQVGGAASTTITGESTMRLEQPYTLGGAGCTS
jgi:Flp pilus assembly protein TadG